MRLNACLWGGAYNPIIPVCRTVPATWKKEPFQRLTGREITDGYLEFFQPDVFVEASSGLANECGIVDSGPGFADRRISSLSDFVVKDEGRRAEFRFGLNIFDVYRKLYKEEFRFVSEHDRHVALIEGQNAHSFFFEAVSGRFPDDEELSYLRNGFVDAFKARESTPSVNELLKILERRTSTPLGFTKYGLEMITRHSRDPIVFIVDPRSPFDLIDLWNLRVFRRDILPISLQWLDQCGDYLLDFVSRNYRPLPRNPHGVMIHTTVELGRSVSEEQVSDTLRNILAKAPQGSWALKNWYDPIWETRHSDAVSRVTCAEIEAESADIDLPIDDTDQPYLRFRSLSPDFANQYGGGDARWVNVLRIRDFGRASNWALTLPSTTKTDSYPGHRVRDSILVSREGFVLRQRYKGSREHIELVSGRNAIVDWLKGRSISAVQSESGRTADQIIKSVDGFWGAHILAHADTLNLLNKMSKSIRTYAGGETVEEYPDRTATVDEWKEMLGRRSDELLRPKAEIDDFVKAGALKLGLELVCPNCEKRNWYGIGGLSERIECDRCLLEFDFPQGALNFSRTPWRFRVAGPFAVPDFADGAYATVLALCCLHRGLGSGDQSITYSTNLNLSLNGGFVEVDFACWYRRDWFSGQQEEPVFVIGEAKSFADDAITERDVRRLKRIAQELPGVILVFAVLKNTLSKAEKEMLSALATWGRHDLADGRQRAPLVVLTGTELFSAQGVQQEWEEAGGLRKRLISPGTIHIDNLITLADLTQQAYLALPSYWSWWEDRFKKKISAKKKAGRRTIGPK